MREQVGREAIVGLAAGWAESALAVRTTSVNGKGDCDEKSV
jgi:hypothetical protein